MAPVLPPPLGPLAWLFTRIGNTVFGGGAATIVILQEHMIARGWLDRDRARLVFAMCRITPGTNVMAFCAGAGWLMRGLPGALVTLLAASIPCSIATVLLTMGYQTWTQNPLARNALGGATACAVALMLASAWTLVRPEPGHASPRAGLAPRGNRPPLPVLAICLGTFLLEVVWGVSPLRAIALCAVVGALWPTGGTGVIPPDHAPDHGTRTDTNASEGGDASTGADVRIDAPRPVVADTRARDREEAS